MCEFTKKVMLFFLEQYFQIKVGMLAYAPNYNAYEEDITFVNIYFDESTGILLLKYSRKSLSGVNPMEFLYVNLLFFPFFPLRLTVS